MERLRVRREDKRLVAGVYGRGCRGGVVVRRRQGIERFVCRRKRRVMGGAILYRDGREGLSRRDGCRGLLWRPVAGGVCDIGVNVQRCRRRRDSLLLWLAGLGDLRGLVRDRLGGKWDGGWWCTTAVSSAATPWCWLGHVGRVSRT
jgi:hypothetical protein